MKPDSSSIGSLPVKILCFVFHLLGPFGLVSINQTSSKFHKRVQPQRTHFTVEVA
ncbi:hypothetical protein PDIG_27340 [Penicillium digitatum PHI26]|uniref:F-box domain-containing protein n=2 Tax=Penicillium digitatum TaxID=36651 RepID=K9GQA4_PEND2|nr:hypothetical protein PDIP_61780 [Penicillium digitatum Pd1]EKV10040.1 hypothetical protein PDIP_61780 [Penicillium digitatum Pd1]EKV15296.1 hypothetical protein PDIG_27340 [Penicillium digitatum PHI26]